MTAHSSLHPLPIKMKNVLVYINPLKHFDADIKKFRHNSKLACIQIDNSLDLGWNKKDILLFTNFPYEYNGVKATVLDSKLYCPFRPLSTKTATVAYLLENKMIEKDYLYWVHDFDAYQLNPFGSQNVNLGKAKVGFTDYGWSSKWCLGSYFFRSAATEIFTLLRDTIYKLQAEDERALVALTNENIGDINEKIKRLNITFNFGMRMVGTNYKNADKPIKVLHFHPYYTDNRLPHSTLDCFMYGKNELDKPLMDTRLIKIFNSHGVK